MCGTAVERERDQVRQRRRRGCALRQVRRGQPPAEAVMRIAIVVLGASGRQQALGAVLNAHPTLPRRERDALRALLHNCAVHGWESQSRGRPNFREYVLGRISWATALDLVFGAKLRAAFNAVPPAFPTL